MGSPLRVSGKEGEETYLTYGYDEFGNDLGKELEQAGIPNPYSRQGEEQPFGYTGYRYDSISDTYFAQAREYRPENGRFTAEDVIKGNGLMPQTLNPYIYCLNNPLALVDLDGRFPTREEVEEIINDITAKYNRTLTYGVDLSGTLGIFSVDGSIGISIDCKGNIAFQSTGTWDVMASSSPSAAVSIFRTKTNASCIDDLNEYGGCIGASVGVPIYGVPVCFGGDFIIVGDLGNKISDGGNYYGYSLAIGVGVPGIEAHAGQSYTKTEGSSINIIEIFLDWIYGDDKKEGICNE